MKTPSIFILSILCGILAACEPAATAASTTPVTGTTGTEITLSPGQSVSLAGTDLTITFHSIVADDRCPSEVECVASGPVTVSLAVQQGQAESMDFTLQTFTDQTGRSPNVQFEGITNRAEVGSYVIQLSSVTPYPTNLTTSIDPSEYRVSLIVSNK